MTKLLPTADKSTAGVRVFLHDQYSTVFWLPTIEDVDSLVEALISFSSYNLTPAVKVKKQRSVRKKDLALQFAMGQWRQQRYGHGTYVPKAHFYLLDAETSVCYRGKKGPTVEVDTTPESRCTHCVHAVETRLGREMD